MESCTPDFWMTRAPDSYTVQEDADYMTWHTGVIVLRGEENTVSTALTIAARAFMGELDYNLVSGWYKLVAYAKKRNEWLFFGDNTGSQYLFYDTENHVFSDSLLYLRSLRGTRAQPDMEAVAELLYDCRTFHGKTLVSGIKKTDPAHYYRFRQNKVEEFGKGLINLSQMQPDFGLDDVIRPILQAIKDEKVCAVCTGGSDSRSILAVLTHFGIKPGLVITGHADNPDIAPAKQIAGTLGLPLTVIDPAGKEADWMETAFVFLDGAYDVVLSYRHLQKARWAKESGYAYEFGGVGGEFYKNDFCHPFRWGLLNKRDEAYFSRNIFRGSTQGKPWHGDALRQAVANSAACFSAVVQEGMGESGLLPTCNHIGHVSLGSASGAITNGYASMCCKIDPLMDRNLVAAASQERPLSHAMYVWQRRQIAQYCPSLAEIPTDRGYSCSLQPMKLFKERAKKLWFYAGRVTARVRRLMGLPYQPGVAPYWDADYQEARASKAWADAVAYCKSTGIIQSNAADAEIPMEQTGVILLIGMMFSEDFDQMMARCSHDQSFHSSDRTGLN